MSGRVSLREGEDYIITGQELQAITLDAQRALSNAISNIAWPFIEQLRVNDGSNSFIFVEAFSKFDKAKEVLQENAPVESTYS